MVLGKLSAMEDHLKEMTRQAEEFNHHQHLYGLPVNEFSALGDIKTDFDMAAAFNKVDIEFSPKWARENPMSVPSVVASADAASIN